MNECLFDNSEIYNYSFNKYGEKLDEVRYYETKEIRDSNSHLVFPKGKELILILL